MQTIFSIAEGSVNMQPLWTCSEERKLNFDEKNNCHIAFHFVDAFRISCEHTILLSEY
jgi:hypothetical protein